MKHFLTYIDEAIKQYWNEPALTNYGANTITYGDELRALKSIT